MEDLSESRQEVQQAVDRARLWLYAAFASQIVVSVAVLFFAFDYVLRNNPLASGAVAVVALLALGYAWFAAVAPVRRGNLSAAVAPTVILGLVGIPFGLIIVGVLYILAYLRIREASERSGELAASP